MDWELPLDSSLTSASVDHLGVVDFGEECLVFELVQFVLVDNNLLICNGFDFDRTPISA